MAKKTKIQKKNLLSKTNGKQKPQEKKGNIDSDKITILPQKIKNSIKEKCADMISALLSSSLGGQILEDVDKSKQKTSMAHSKNVVYDILILGGGVSGALAAYTLSNLPKSTTKKLKIGIVEFGRQPGKRRKQLEGWFGCFPSSNSRLYLNDVAKLSEITGEKATLQAKEQFDKLINQVLPKAICNKRKLISSAANSRFEENGFDVEYNDFIQLDTVHVHALSKLVADTIYDNDNVDMLFDCEVMSIERYRNLYNVKTEYGTIKARNLINCLGRSGWRLSVDIYKNLDIELNNDFAHFGFRGEMPASLLKDLNQANITLKSDTITVGPISWKGTIIPEDHCDVAISSWRSNEERWESEKVAFSVTNKVKYPNRGIEQTERLAKLAYVLLDNRVSKIRVKEYLSNENSKLSNTSTSSTSSLSDQSNQQILQDPSADIKLIPEYQCLTTLCSKMNCLFPGFLEKGYMHLPDILTCNENLIDIDKTLSTKKIKSLFVAGEAAGLSGLYSAALSGIIAAKNCYKQITTTAAANNKNK